jgi:hypothetical protein
MRGPLAVVLVALVTSPVAAQPAPAQAETLFRQGRDLMSAGKFAEACAAFASSQKLDPAPTTQLNLADCREKNGQLATAWGVFVEVERQLRGTTDARQKKLLEVATKHAAQLEPRLSKLAINVSADHQIAGLEVVRDKDLVDAGAWNHALPIDGGTYTITARAPGKETWTTKVTIKTEGDAQTIEVPALGAPKVATTPPPPPPTKQPEPEETPEETPAGPSRAMPIALSAGAVVLLGGALGFDLWGDSTYDQSKKEPDLAKQTDLWHSANTKRYVAEGMLGAGVACAGVAVWLWLRHPAQPEAVARGAHVEPFGLAGLQLSVRY